MQIAFLNGHSRANRRLLLLAAIVAIATMFGGCAARNAYKQGRRLLAEGQYDAAVRQLEHAQAEWPDKFLDDEEFQATLRRAKLEGADHRLDQARRCADLTDLGQAEEHLVTALRYNPDLAACQPLLDDVRTQIRRAESIRESALALGEAGQWPEAIAEMQKALDIYRTLPRGRNDMKQLRRRASEKHLGLAREHLAADRWAEAETEARKSLEYQSNAGAKGVLTEIANRRKADDLVRQATEYEADGEYLAALDSLIEAESLHRTRVDLPAKLARVRRLACDDLINHAGELTLTSDHAGALRLLSKSREILPDYRDVAGRIRAARRALADEHLSLARAKYNQQALGAAVAHYLAAAGYGDDSRSAGGIADCLSALRTKTRYHIGVVGFDAADGDEKIAEQLQAAALQQLLRVKPANVAVMDRIDLKRVLDEQDFSLSDLVDPRFKVPSGKLKGVDGILTGRVISCDVHRDQTSRWGRSEYQFGTKMKPNPAHADAVERVRQAERDLARARQVLGATQAARAISASVGPNGPSARISHGASDAGRKIARQKVAAAREMLLSAQSQLAQTPAQIAVPNVVEHKYPILRVTATAKCVASVKVLDAMTGDVLLAEPVTGEASASDRQITGDPLRNVPADPLDLPGDDYLRNRAAADATDQLDDAVARAASLHGLRFAVMARRAAADRSLDAAVEYAMCYLLSYPTGGDHAEEMVEIVAAELCDEADLLDARKLLARHCRVLLTPGRLPAAIRQADDSLIVTGFDDRRLARRFSLPCELTAVNGVPVSTHAQLQAVLRDCGVGDQVSLTVKGAGGRTQTKRVTLVTPTP